MFKPNPLDKAATEEQIRIFSEIAGTDPNSKEFSDGIDHIAKIETVKTKKTVISKDAVLGAAVSILGILVVINAEHVGAVTSKAFSMVRKA